MKPFSDKYGDKKPEKARGQAKPTLLDLFEINDLPTVKLKVETRNKTNFDFFCGLLERRNATVFIANALKFIGLSADDQRYIIAAHEDGVYWRGEDIDYFRNVFNETLAFRELDPEGKANFIGNAKKRLLSKQDHGAR